MFPKFFFRKKTQEEKKQQLVCCRCFKVYKASKLQIVENTLLRTICHSCVRLVQEVDNLEFSYSGSDHYHSKNKKLLIVVKSDPYPNIKLYFALFGRDSTAIRWTYFGKTYDFIDAIKIANKIIV